MADSRIICVKLFGLLESLFPFCKSLMIVVLSVMDSFPLSFMWLIALLTRGAKDGQKVLSNLTVNPSIPGAEFGFMSLKRDSSIQAQIENLLALFLVHQVFVS